MSDHDISQRRACRLVSVDPKTVRREAEPDNPEIRKCMREIAATRRRFGYRRIGLMLEREGIVMNHKKLRRLYREEGLAVKRRRGRKRATGTREPMPVPDGPSKRWSLDFVSDVFGPARRFRMLNVIDDYTRQCLALVADTSLSGARVARELDRCIRLYGRPETIVSDNGTELTSRAILEWQNETGIAWHYIAPGKPQHFLYCSIVAPHPPYLSNATYMQMIDADAITLPTYVPPEKIHPADRYEIIAKADFGLGEFSPEAQVDAVFPLDTFCSCYSCNWTSGFNPQFRTSRITYADVCQIQIQEVTFKLWRMIISINCYPGV